MTKAVQIVSFVTSYLVFRFIGANSIFPLAGFFGTSWLLKKIPQTKTIGDHRRIAISILSGHIFWLLAAVALMPNIISNVALDFIFMISGLIFLLTKNPNKKIMWGLIGLQILGLLVNITSIAGQDTWAPLTMHIILRSLFIVYTFLAIKNSAQSISSGSDKNAA